MTYKEALDYIHGVSWTFCKPGLSRTVELCSGLGDPQKKLKFVHVAGTNGKGSFCSMLSAVLREAGYKVGLYTSPYIRVFNERMQVNGEPISDERLAKITEAVRPVAESMTDKPTEFELITAIAFKYFEEEECDIVVLEAGMGGRLDSTNVITTPILSVITGIALDHTAFLGDTVEKIAAEKAGIIKNVPVLFGGTDEDARRVISKKAEEMGVDFYETDYSLLSIKKSDLTGTVFDFDGYVDLKIKLLGTYQPRNAASVITAAGILNREGLQIGEQDIRNGLYAAVWPARFELLRDDPIIIFDGAHNPEGISAAVDSIKKYFPGERVAVFSGVLKDKDYRYIAAKLSEIADKAFTVTPDNPRALCADDYATELSSFGVDATPNKNVKEAIERAYGYAVQNKKPLVFLGSLYTYSEVIDIIEAL